MSYKTLGRVLDELEQQGILVCKPSNAGVRYYGFPDLMNSPLGAGVVSLMFGEVLSAVVLDGMKIDRITPEQEVERLQQVLDQAPKYLRGKPRQKARFLRNLRILIRERILDIDEQAGKDSAQ